MKRKFLVSCVAALLLAGGPGGNSATAQPQPLPNPLAARFPTAPLPNMMDDAVAVRLWEAQGDNNPVPPFQLVARKVFVAGTVRYGGGNYIAVAKYHPDTGALEDMVFWPPDIGDDISYSRREAKAMVIPVVDYNTDASEGRVFVVGTTDGWVGSTDIVVLAYNFNFKLLWSQTFNAQPVEGWAGDDIPVAITTDQSPDIVTNHDTSYNYVAVLGSSVNWPSGTRAVTLAYCKGSGQPVMLPRFESGMPDPVDIAAASTQDLCGTPTIFITGSTSEAQNAGEIMVQCYHVPDISPCGGTINNGVTPPGWPGIYPGNPLDYWAKPARMKFTKGKLIITGTTRIVGQPAGETDMLTFVLSPCGVAAPVPDWKDQWAVPENPSVATPRTATAVDMDLVFFSQPYAVVTGSATSRVNGRTGVASMAYKVFTQDPQDPTSQRHWVKGALWNGTSSLFDDQPTAIRCIKATDTNMPSGTGFNAYISAKTRDFGGFGYVTLKYDGAAQTNPAAYKELSWSPSALPYYFSPGAGDSIPAQLAVEYSPGVSDYTQTRRVWTTGTSRGVSSGDDWATQFIVEQLP